MGIKKYEIITVGGDKRVRALRSWRVQDRYVNIGDVGGIVYDEKTLSQDGACWLFRGNFNFPGARIGGDSVVDVGEEVPDVNSPTPDLNILGSSAVVGSKVRFSVTSTAADAVTLTAADFEQGVLIYSEGVNWEAWKMPSASNIRLKAPIFTGGKSVTLKVEVPGYAAQAYVLDRDGIGIATISPVQTGEGVTVTVPAGQYFTLRLAKNPSAAIVPADATAAQIKFTGVYKNTLNIVDSRVSINSVTDTANRVSVILGGNYQYTTGGEFPPCNIVGSTVNLTRDAATSRSIYIVAGVENSNVSVNATSGNAVFIGVYSNVKNLVYNLPTALMSMAGKNSIQATDCDNFTVSPTTFPGLADAQSANMPFIFQGCNVPNGLFYHHAQIANTYKDIDFAKAQADLGKSISGGRILASAEVEGMYRLATGTGGLIGSLVESHISVAKLAFSNFATIYNTTIYADAYFDGLFDIKGTNVFGNTMEHDAGNTQVMDTMLYWGSLTSTVGQVPSLVTGASRVSTIVPFRINGANGILIDKIPAGVQVAFMVCDAQGKFVVTSTWKTAPAVITNITQLQNAMAYITFKKANDTSISVDEVKGVTITTYNGCKIVNTKATAATIAGNIRVEDNATLIDTSVTGTGYFGGNSIAQGLTVEGTVYMKDNAVFAPTISGTPKANILQMTDNASFTGGWSGVGTRLTMFGNAQFRSTVNYATTGFVTMRDNADISGSGSVAVSGALVLQDDASISAGAASISGDITLCGKYTQTASKTWAGKRVIDDQNAPQYDDNVKTKYDI